MTQIGNHLKMTLASAHRARTRELYGDVLGCRVLESPRPELDLFEFEGGFVLGIFYVANEPVLSDDEQLRATWLELKTADPKALEAKLVRFGVKPVPFSDPSRFYFQAPGGPVFRVAPLDGAL
jgi:hypothetical protein